MPDPNAFLAGRVRPQPGQDPNAFLAGGGGGGGGAAADPNSFLAGAAPPPSPPSAGPLDPRPAARAVGQAVGQVVPEPVKDLVGMVGGAFAKRLGAVGEVIAQPFLKGADLAPERLRGAILQYPYLDPSERAMVESWGPSRADTPLVAPGAPFDPMDAVRRLGALVPAIIEGKTPAGEPASVVDLLRSRGFSEPFGPSVEQAEAANRRNLGFPIGSIARMATSPETAALGVETAGVPLLNAVGRAALPIPVEAARQALNAEGRLPQALARVPGKGKVATAIRAAAGKEVRTRALPGVKETLEFFGPEKSLPNRIRRPIEDILRKREGEANLRAFLREKALGPHGKLPEATQDRIADAIERRAISALPAEEQQVARALERAFREEVVTRQRSGLRRFELGAHLPGMEAKWRGAEAEATVAGIQLADLRTLQAELPKVIRTGERARAEIRDVERRYLATGRGFAKLSRLKQIHADALAEEKAIRATLRQNFPRAAAAAHVTAKEARTLKRAYAEAGGFKDRVAFAKRVMTKEKRLEAGEKPYGAPIEPSGLSTGKMRERLADVERTSADINLESIQKRGYRAFEPVVQATLKSGAANDTRVMNAGILVDAVRKFGRAARPGEKTLADIYGAKSGFNPRMQKVLERTAVDPEIHQYLERLNHSLTPERFGRWVNAWRTVNDQFKKWALFSPGFVSRNVQNNLIQTMIHGNTDVRNWTDSFHLRRKLARAKTLDDLKGVYVRTGKTSTIRADQYIASAIKRGVIGRGQAAIETGKSFAEGRLNLFKHLRSGNEFAEDVSRMAFDLHLQRVGYSPLEAARKVDQVLFNYSPRFSSKGFQRTRRYAIPFINWASQIVPLAIRNALERPGSVGLISSAIEKQNRAQGFSSPAEVAKLGKDIADQGGIVVGKTLEGKTRIVKPTGYGSYDANAILAPIVNKDVWGFVDELASRSYPQISIPYALLRGKDPLTNAELTGKPVPGPPALKFLFTTAGGRAWAERHGIFQDAKDPTTIRVPDRLNIVLRSIPPLRLVNLLADAVKPDRRARTRAQSFFLGVSEVERDAAQQERFGKLDVKRQVGRAGRPGDAVRLLMKYPPAARKKMAEQFSPEVQRALIQGGVIEP